MNQSLLTPVPQELLLAQFELVCDGFCKIYEGFRQDPRLQAYYNDENQLRNFLIGRDHLGSRSMLAKLQLHHYSFRPESYQLNDQDFPTGGRCDIEVELLEWKMELDRPYFLFECKRLDGKAHLADQYVKEGIQRFTNSSKYPAIAGRAGMIGFLVRQVPITNEINLINQKINQVPGSQTRLYPLILPTYSGFEGCHFSVHTCKDGQQLHLRHIIYALA